MQRPPLPRRPRHRRHALARVAGAAGVAVFIAALCACKGGDAPGDAVAAPVAQPPTTSASAPVVGGSTSPIPPPPDLSRLPAEPTAASGTTADALAAAHAQLESALAGAASCSSDAECRSIGVGGKACGGPTGYRAYSAKGTDPATIEALARHEHELALQEARESHRVSNCMMLRDPGARCQANKCVTAGPSVNSPATR